MADKKWDLSKKGEIDKFNVDLETRLKKFKEEFGIELLERVRARTPVRTGDLKGGWGFQMRQESIDIYNTKDYAGYVEFGTEKMAPRAMLRTSLLEKEQIAEIAKEKASK